MVREASHGILNPHAGEAYFQLDRSAPSADLTSLVEFFWVVRWRLAAARTFDQETLPHPNVHLVVGTLRPGVHGVASKRFIAKLQGEGYVVGAKFRPGGFFPFLNRDVIELTERELPISSVFGDAGAQLETAAMHAGDHAERIVLIENFLRSRNPVADDLALLAARATEIIRTDPALARVSDLAARIGLSRRALDRLFRRYVGVSPKWVIRRYRIHEACERIAAGNTAVWPALAHELGYFDQSHFIRDFKSQVGKTPSAYASSILIRADRSNAAYAQAR